MGTFVDRRITAEQFPLVRVTGFNNKRDPVDHVTSKLEALHLYQLAIPAPKPPEGSFDATAAARGEQIFAGKAGCATCHVPPLFSEPGWPMHTGTEIGIDDFQADRSPDRMYRTTPLRGLFARLKPGLYHDGRFPTLEAVIDHYSSTFGFTLTAQEKADLVEYLKSI
jgi:cytochrome c peroxidase